MNRRLAAGLLCSLVPLLLAMAGTVGAQSDGEYITCYNYTWTGKNTSVDCEDHILDIMNQAQPCLYTLVYTTPPYLPPNTSDLQRHCSTVQKCPSYTCKTKKNCVKLMWYDITETLVNYSSFCGSVVDVTDPTTKKEISNVELEMEVGTYTKKLRVCDQHLCNAAGPLGGSPGTVLVTMVVMMAVMRMGLVAAERGDG